MAIKIEKVKFKVCSVINGDEASCKLEYCPRCSFKLPRLDETALRICQLYNKKEE